MPKRSNLFTLLCMACMMLAATLVTSCNNDTAKQEDAKTDSVPASNTPTPATPTTPDSSTLKKDSLPPVDSSTTPRPDTKKT